jgi:hypothetical protein
VSDHDLAAKMLNTFQHYLEEKANQQGGLKTVQELLGIITAAPRPGVIWRRLLRAGAQRPETIGFVLRSLAWDHTILTASDTTRLTGAFLRVVYPTLCPADRERIERVIIAIPSTVAPPDIAHHHRDRLLGCLAPALFTTVEARLAFENLTQAGGPPRNAEEDDEAHWGTLHAATTPEQQALLTLLRPITEFATKHLNTPPTTQEIDEILPAMERLQGSLVSQSPTGALQNQVLSDISQAVAAIGLNDELPWTAETSALLRAMALHAARHPSPEPDRAEDKHRFITGWGAAPRIVGAEAVMSLARHQACLDDEIRTAIINLSTDLAATVRLQIAARLGYLFQTAPALLWGMLDYYARREENPGVVHACLGALHRIGQSDAAKSAILVEAIFDRFTDGAGSREIRDACISIFGGLALWHQDSHSRGVLARLLAAPLTYSRDLPHLASDLGGCITNDEIRDASFELLERTLSAAMLAARSLEQTHGSTTVWPETAQELSVAAKKGTSLAVEREPGVGLRSGLRWAQKEGRS